MTFETNEHGGWIIPAGTNIPAETSVPAFSRLGNDCTLGNWCDIGTGCRLGDGCRLGTGCNLGNDCTLEGVVARHWLTLANVDGTGRQILVVSDGATTKIRAGCFVGTPDEFVAKAKIEGKTRYASVIPAVVAAMLAEDGAK